CNMEGAGIRRINSVPEADALLPTEFGDFRIRAFRAPVDGKDPAVGYVGDLTSGSPLVRVHSECLTGDAFHSLRCDCGPQLHASMKAIQERGQGAIAYMRQEGRGIGLYAKMQAYALQDTGLDTLDANLALGLPADARKYDFAAEMLYSMGITSVELVTNNPDKRDQLLDHGIEVTNRVPIIVGQCAQNRSYMKTKGARMGHLLPN
ncbi:MAG: GTP cyclohydrolase II, partial [Candidatus Thermoplasmatota archaeon]|nr:GTP cyclohydrolase II [Candidatus Thermoplasmatota archaeon]